MLIYKANMGTLSKLDLIEKCKSCAYFQIVHYVDDCGSYTNTHLFTSIFKPGCWVVGGTASSHSEAYIENFLLTTAKPLVLAAQNPKT